MSLNIHLSTETSKTEMQKERKKKSMKKIEHSAQELRDGYKRCNIDMIGISKVK